MSQSQYSYPQTDYSSQSSRSYPRFISLQETLGLHLSFAWRGLVESNRWDIVLTTITGDAEIRANIYKSLLLNSLSLVSIYAFDLLLQPLVRDEQKWLHRNVGRFYQVLWLLPVVGVSFYLNSSWCTVIAKRAFTLQHGSRASAPPVTYSGMLTAVATSAYRAVMVCTSVSLSFILGNIPYAGPVASFVFMCWIDSYYCFEFIWIARGMSLARRVRFLEERWAYYLAFGLPSTALCMWGSSLANVAIFALLFPSYIIMAMHASPVPVDPFSPSPQSYSDPDVVRHPSPFVPIRVPVFALVMWLNDWIARILSIPIRGPEARRIRALSDTSRAESVEEGDSKSATSAKTSERVFPPRRQMQAGGRINIGTSRRKLD